MGDGLDTGEVAAAGPVAHPSSSASASQQTAPFFHSPPPPPPHPHRGDFLAPASEKRGAGGGPPPHVTNKMKGNKITRRGRGDPRRRAHATLQAVRVQHTGNGAPSDARRHRRCRCGRRRLRRCRADNHHGPAHRARPGARGRSHREAGGGRGGGWEGGRRRSESGPPAYPVGAIGTSTKPPGGGPAASPGSHRPSRQRRRPSLSRRRPSRQA